MILLWALENCDELPSQFFKIVFSDLTSNLFTSICENNLQVS